MIENIKNQLKGKMSIGNEITISVSDIESGKFTDAKIESLQKTLEEILTELRTISRKSEKEAILINTIGPGEYAVFVLEKGNILFYLYNEDEKYISHSIPIEKASILASKINSIISRAERSIKENKIPFAPKLEEELSYINKIIKSNQANAPPINNHEITIDEDFFK